jgi:hypothetical protein
MAAAPSIDGSNKMSTRLPASEERPCQPCRYTELCERVNKCVLKELGECRRMVATRGLYLGLTRGDNEAA